MSKTSSQSNNVAMKAGIWYVFSSIMVKMVSIITTPIFTRALTTDEYGTVATFSSWYSMFLVIYGLNLTVSIGRAKIDYSDKLDEYIGSLQLLSLFVSVAISAAMGLFIRPVSSFLELTVTETLLLFLYLISSPVITFAQSGYRYKYKYKQNIAIAWYTTISTVVISLLLISLLKSNDRALLRIVGITVPSLLLSLFFWVKAIKNRTVSINTTYWKYGLAISLPMILHAISMNVLAQSDRVVISKYCGATSVAFYSLTMNYALLLFVVTDAINQAWQPWFHDNYNDGKNEEIRNNTKKLVVLICYLGLACIAIGPEAIMILGGEQYAEAIACIPPMVLGVVCQCIYTHYINIELHWKQTKYASIGTMIAAAVNMILNLVFVPIFGYVAAAFTTFFSYLVLMVLHCYITHKKLNVSLYDDQFMFLAMIITGVVSVIVAITYDHTFARMALILIGFLSFLIYFREQITEKIITIEKKREKL